MKIKKIPKSITFTAKLLFTVFLVAFILWKVNWSEVQVALVNSNLILILIVFGLMNTNIFLSTIKWKILLSIHDIDYSFGDLCRYYYSAFFFNNFLPTNVGGDGYRIFKTFKNPRSKAGAIVAILVERITGILGLLFLGVVASAVVLIKGGDKFAKITFLLGLIGIGISIVMGFLIIIKKKISLFKRLESFSAKINKLVSRIGDFRNKNNKIAQIVFISILFHTFFIMFRFLLIDAVGAQISVFDLAIAVVLSTVLALIPITLNGIGLMDGSFIYLLVNYGVNYDKAVIVMLLVRVLQIPLSMMGGLFYFLEKQSIKTKKIDTEEINSFSEIQ